MAGIAAAVQAGSNCWWRRGASSISMKLRRGKSDTMHAGGGGGEVRYPVRLRK